MNIYDLHLVPLRTKIAVTYIVICLVMVLKDRLLKRQLLSAADNSFANSLDPDQDRCPSMERDKQIVLRKGKTRMISFFLCFFFQTDALNLVKIFENLFHLSLGLSKYEEV